jgi:hypothetical protein
VVTGLVISSLALQLTTNAGVPTVDWVVSNPICEVVLPVMVRAGPMGTVWDSIVGVPAGNILAAGAAIALLALWTGRPVRPQPSPARRPVRGVALALLVCAALLHLGLVSLPRTVELPRQATVLRARWFTYRYMGKETLSLETEARAIRKERRGTPRPR